VLTYADKYAIDQSKAADYSTLYGYGYTLGPQVGIGHCCRTSSTMEWYRAPMTPSSNQSVAWFSLNLDHIMLPYTEYLGTTFGKPLMRYHQPLNISGPSQAVGISLARIL
jgi:hypothetical protein